MWQIALCTAAVAAAATRTAYEAQYGCKLKARAPDEVYNEPLNRLAFGSCQNLHLGRNGVYPEINKKNPDLFLYTGDIMYPQYGCCEPECVEGEYNKARAHPDYQKFRAQLKRIDGVYDDHDFGINDGHDNYKHKKKTLQYLLDFLEKPANHYRRKREGAYFSALYRDPRNRAHSVKIVALDMRYHRKCFYFCACRRCNWKKKHMYQFMFHRHINYYFGFGCNHKADSLGEEQWRWLEGQLHNSDAQTHVIVSSVQVFTNCPITESWGLLPEAKDRLVELLKATKPKNAVFISGDVHWGEIIEADGITEVTSSSLTHAFLEEYARFGFLLSLVATYWGHSIYGHNNFGLIDFAVNKDTGHMTHDIQLVDEFGGTIYRSKNDGTRDPLEPYLNIESKPRSMLKDTRIIKCTSLRRKIVLGYLLATLLNWLLLGLYIPARCLLELAFGRKKSKLE